MAKYKIVSVEPHANSDVHLDVRVYKTGTDPDVDPDIGHFTVVLNAAEVKQAEGMTPAQRGAYLKALFEADTRISGIIESEEASDLLNGWYNFPLTLTL